MKQEKENVQSVISKINSEFERLKEATDYIDQSKSAVQKLISFTDKISQNLISDFSQSISRIENSHLKQSELSKKEIEALLENLIIFKDTIENLTTNLLLSLEPPIKKFEELSEKSKSIIQKIDTINFPERLDKLENSVNTNFSEILVFNREVNKQSQELIEDINQVNFKALIDELKKSIVETTEKIVEFNAKTENRIIKQSEIQNAFTEKLTQEIEELKIPTRISNLEKSLEKFLTEIHDLNSETQNRIKELVKSLDGINISQRLDKLDASIAGINQSIQTLIQRFEPLERNLKEGQQNKATEVVNLMSSIEVRNKEFVNQLIEKKTKSLQEAVEKNHKEAVENWHSMSKENRILKMLIIITLALSAASIGISFLI